MHPVEELMELIAGAPGFEVPAPVQRLDEAVHLNPAVWRTVANPVGNIAAAICFLDELDGADAAPYAIASTLRFRVSAALETLPDADGAALAGAWQRVWDALTAAALIAPPDLRGRFRQLAKLDAGIASVLAAGMATLSLAVDEFRIAVSDALDVVGRPGLPLSPRQAAARHGVSRDVIYDSVGDGSIPASRLGSLIKIEPDSVMEATRIPAPDEGGDSASAEGGGRPRRRGSGDNIAGTGVRDW